MPASFLLFLNHLVFLTLYMQVCSTVKCQIDGSLVKVYFLESVGPFALDAYFYSIFFFWFITREALLRPMLMMVY